MGEKHSPYFLILPAFLTLFIITIFPFVYCVGLSFLDYNLKFKSTIFVGLQNYVGLLQDFRFLNSLKNTGIYTITAVLSELLLGLLIATLLNEVKRGKNIFTTFLTLPLLSTPVVMSITFKNLILHTTAGLLNYFLEFFIPYPIPWLADPNLALISVILIDVWQWTPFVMLILHAGLQGLPMEPFEAARVDGASRWQTFKFITVPLLKPIIIIALLFRVTDCIKAFDIIYAATEGGPGVATETMNLYAFTNAFVYLNMGYASAIVILMFLVSYVLSTLFFKYASPVR